MEPSMFISPPPPQSLPNPYQSKVTAIASLLALLQTPLDRAAAAQVAQPWVYAVRDNPLPF